jgi:subtilisin family serine protease
MSWGSTASSLTAQTVVSWAAAQGAVLVAAAGNNNASAEFYPAAYPECIGVAATNASDMKVSTSNYGRWAKVSAPGQNVNAPIAGNSYGPRSGTSIASGMAAGLAGLMRSLNSHMPADDLRGCLTINAARIDVNNPSYTGDLGAGRIDAAAAMTCVGATLDYPPTAAFEADQTNIRARLFDVQPYHLELDVQWRRSLIVCRPQSSAGRLREPRYVFRHIESVERERQRH